jgi:hypothetical protein
MTDTQGGRGPVRGPHAIAIGLFLLVWLSCAWFGSSEYNPNNTTRLFAAISLAQQGDATIDEFQALTIDKAQFGGHYYMDKTPGMTLMALPAMWVADRLAGNSAARPPVTFADPRYEPFMKLRLRLAVATTAAVLIAFAAVLLFDLATGITGSPKAGLVAALGYAMATPAWGWSTTMFGHAPVGLGDRGRTARRIARRRDRAVGDLAHAWRTVAATPGAGGNRGGGGHCRFDPDAGL